MNRQLVLAISACADQRDPVAFYNLLKTLQPPLQLAFRQLWAEHFLHLVSIDSPLIAFHLFTL